jgi:hypothetical protein
MECSWHMEKKIMKYTILVFTIILFNDIFYKNDRKIGHRAFEFVCPILSVPVIANWK